MIGAGQQPPTRSQLDLAAAEIRRHGAPAGAADFPAGPDVRPWDLHDRVERACRAFFAGVDFILHECDGGDWARFAARCGVPAHEMELLDATPAHDWAMIARPDLVVAGDRVAVVEPNAAPMVVLFPLHDMLLRAHDALPGARDQLTARNATAHPAMPAFARMLRAQLTVPDGIVLIGYWAREDHDTAAPSQHWHYRTMIAELARYGVTARFGPLEDLELHGDRVLLDGERVGAVYRNFESPEADATPQRALLRKLLEHVRAGAVGLVTGFAGEVCVAKMCLALLSEDAYLDRMSPELAAGLRACVPWTRVLDDDPELLRQVREDRTRLVIKPVRGHGGIDVVIGREVADDDWARLIDAAVADRGRGVSWLAQELILATPEPYLVTGADGIWRDGEAAFVTSAFMVDRRVVGLMHRYGLSPDGSLNINGGTGFSPVPVWWTGAPAPADIAGPVVAIWAEALGIESVGPDDDFFAALGGFSLSAAVVVAAAAERLALPLELRDIYLAPTPREFAARADTLRARLTALDAAARHEPGPLASFTAALAEFGATSASRYLAQDVTLTVTVPAGGGEPEVAASGRDEVTAVLTELRGAGAVRRAGGPGSFVLDVSGAVDRRLIVSGSARDGLLAALSVSEGG